MDGMALGFLELIVLALAAYRLTRFFVFDSLLGFGIVDGRFASGVAERIDKFAYTQDEIDDQGKIITAGGTNRSFVRGKIGDLLTCTFCLGFWISLAVYFIYLGATVGMTGIEATPWAVHGITVFGIAGAQAYINSRPFT